MHHKKRYVNTALPTSLISVYILYISDRGALLRLSFSLDVLGLRNLENP